MAAGRAFVSGADDAVSVFHGNIDDAACIQSTGFDVNRLPVFTSTDINAARNAIGAGRFEIANGLARNPGIIESRVPRNLFDQFLLPSQRSYSGFGGGIRSTEIPLRTSQQVSIFNRYTVR